MFFFISVFIAFLVYRLINAKPKIPNFDYEKWWGAGTKPDTEDTSITRFKIEFNDTMIQDLKQRLRNKRQLTKPLEGINSEYGMNTVYLEKILKYWADEYDFKKRVELLNKFPHYKTRIQGLDLHYMKIDPEAQGLKVVPILLLHGWPSSSKEFDKLIPLLTREMEGYNFVFQVIAVDLPGFGFSEGTNKPGLSPVQMAIIIRNLMKRLDFHKFYIQAGDWGSQVATHMATLFPDQVLGFHSNMPISSTSLSTVKDFLHAVYWSILDVLRWEKEITLTKNISLLLRETGYFHLQATKPDSIGVALTDSPAGLASYILEKMAICCNRDQTDTPHGGLENLKLDDALDTVTIMWANSCAVTSMRLYSEGFGRKTDVKSLQNIPTPVPMAAIKFKYEVIYQTDWSLKDKFPNLVRSTEHDFGGHFAALQTPAVLANDVFASVKEFMKFHQNN